MLLAPDRQARINGATLRAHANAEAVYLGGDPFGVLFDRTAADPFSGAADTASLSVAYCIANTPGIAEGAELTIGGAAHIVTGQVQPDAGGWVVLAVYPKA
ncbi:MAG: head-tail joining protein [Giesbergeria sp.]